MQQGDTDVVGVHSARHGDAGHTHEEGLAGGGGAGVRERVETGREKGLDGT